MERETEVAKLQAFRRELAAHVGEGFPPAAALKALHNLVDSLDGKAGRKKLAPPDATIVRPRRGPAFFPHRFRLRGPTAR